MEEVRSPEVTELSEEILESLASMLRVLADPTRLRLIEALQGCDRATVSELTSRVPVGQQGVSHQLLLLHRAGCVSRRREGVRVYYALRDWSGWWLVRELAAEIQARSDAG
jgi:DNA-binding transcriptional ArsR family regulator